ncbi:MAG: HAD family phosphatase [Patescibacteria group bacterium]
MTTIIFDLNGILIQGQLLSERFANELGIGPEEFLPALKDVLAKARISKTAISFQYWQPYLKKLGLEMSEQQFFDFWFSAEKENTEMVALARELKAAGYRLFVLSNNFVERAEYYKKTLPFLDELFIKVYYSWNTGFVKPDKQAYENILTENNLRPEDCFYFDNSQENVEAAKELGIKAYLFTNAEDTRKIIKI